MPRWAAFFRAGTTASGSFAEIAMASTPCAISELMTSIWPSAVGRRRTRVDHLDTAEFLGGFLRTLVGCVEEAVSERLDDEADLHVGSTCGACHHGDGERDAHREFLCEFHAFFLPVNRLTTPGRRLSCDGRGILLHRLQAGARNHERDACVLDHLDGILPGCRRR